MFASVMDTMVEDAVSGTPGAAAPAAGAPAEAGAAPAAGVPGTAGAAGTPAGAPATTGSIGAPDPNLGADAPRVGAAAPVVTGGDPGAAGDADAGPAGGDRSTAWTVDYSTVSADLAGLSQKFEETSTKAFQQQALEGIQTEYKTYFDSLRQHPRMLVGTQVPSLQGQDGEMETLRDAGDAREWQDAVKALLTEEVRERATKSLEENKGILDTVHASIELFTKNKDMVPGTRQFDRVLADRFSSMVKPYELRVEGKLHGYSIPVQPLIEQLRAQIVRERAAAPAVPATPAAAATGRAAGASGAAADGPQAGIGSKAGSSSDDDNDFSTLFGTLGLPNLRI